MGFGSVGFRGMVWARWGGGVVGLEWLGRRLDVVVAYSLGSASALWNR